MRHFSVMQLKRGFSVQAEKEYYSRPPVVFPGYRGLLPYLKLLHPNPEVLFAGKRVLDIGAGECVYTGLIANELGAARVVALDLMRDRMLPAKQSLPPLSVGFVQGSCYNLPFQNQSFDVVFGDLVLHHLPGLAAVISEVRRVLRKPGCYVGLEPNFFNPAQIISRFFERGSDNEYALWPSLVRKEFRHCGFEDVEVRYVWRRLPSLHNPLLSSSVAISARVLA